MKDARAKEAPNRARAQRRSAGLVAQYLHELSQRHALARERGERLRPREVQT